MYKEISEVFETEDAKVKMADAHNDMLKYANSIIKTYNDFSKQLVKIGEAGNDKKKINEINKLAEEAKRSMRSDWGDLENWYGQYLEGIDKLQRYALGK